MPHWGLQMDGPNKLLNAAATALRGAFNAGDADRLLALGRTLGLLSRLAFDDPEFLLRLKDSQHALENAVGQCSRTPRAMPGTTRSTPRCS